MPAGRPKSEVPQDKADSVIEWIESGQTLREWCRQKGNPGHGTVYQWEKKSPEFKERLAHARDIGYHMIAQHCLEIIDEKPTCEVPDPDGGVSLRVDSAGVQRNKNRVWARLELLKCWSQHYNPMLKVENSGSIGIQLVNDIPRPKRD